MDIFSNNYNYDIIIVGGGISGLFTANKLSKTGLKILIIEMNEELGGRIHTIYKTDFHYECAAARFHKNHKKLFGLIHELGLKDKIVPLPKKINYFLRNKNERYYYNTNEKLNLKNLLNDAIKEKKEISKDKLLQLTFFQYLLTIYDSETVQFIKDTFGYDSEIMNLNAHAAIKMFKDDLLSEDDYYILSGGLSQIIEKLEENLKLNNKIFIKRKTQIVNIDNKHIITDNNDKFSYKKLILTIPSEKLKNIDYFKNKVSFDSVKPMKLLRIYAQYSTKNLWFKGIKRTITDNYIRHVIPINEDSGLIMISYTDDIYAEMWDRYSKISEHFLITMLHKEIEKIFGIDPPKPKFISTHYWENGIHLWKPGYDMDEEYDKMLKPIHNEEIYICGESFSKKQGWIEGSLDTCYDIIKSLKIKGFNIENKLNNIEKIKKVKKEKNSLKKYTIDEVLDPKIGKTFIILDHNGKKPIYDIKNWINKHPGGSIIQKGINANKHYKYPEKYDKSPYEIWKSIHSNNILKEMILKDNEFIKCVGELK